MGQEKLKNLEKYGTVLGKSSKTIAAETNIDENAAAIKRKTEKAKFKPEYNPLMGTASGSGAYFRPARRSGPAGGDEVNFLGSYDCTKRRNCEVLYSCPRL